MVVWTLAVVSTWWDHFNRLFHLMGRIFDYKVEECQWYIKTEKKMTQWSTESNTKYYPLRVQRPEITTEDVKLLSSLMLEQTGDVYTIPLWDFSLCWNERYF